MIYGKKPEKNSRKEQKELIITAKVIPDYEKIEEMYGKISKEEIYDIIWKKNKRSKQKINFL